jgi:Skp family chaperone for outer membrane proteins
VNQGFDSAAPSEHWFVSHGGRVVKSTFSKIVLSALVTVVALSVSTASAQEGKQSGIVAVLDVAKVFKENRDFESKMQSIKSTADQLKASIQQKQEAIKQEAGGLQQYEVGSPERNQMEAELVQKQAKLRTEAHQAEVDLLSKEARVYYDTYQQMQSILSSLSSEYGISLVLRFDSEEVDANNRGEVIKGVNRAVVYQQGLDLTKMVIEKMSTNVAAAGGATQR